MISVVMSDYNTNPKYLKQAIESVLNQTYQDFELIIINDGSDNDLESIIKPYHDKRIRIFHNYQNLGLAHSLNKAIEKSKGEYIARMDTDDICLQNRLEKQHQFMKTYDYDVIGCKVIEFDDKKDIGVFGYEGCMSKKDLMHTKMIIHPTVMAKREVFINYPYDDCKRVEDFVLWSNLLLRNYKIFVMNQVLLKYRLNTKDYQKRKYKNRKEEFKYKKIYYRKLGANIIDYCFILKSFISSMLPITIVKFYRQTCKVRKKYEKYK